MHLNFYRERKLDTNLIILYYDYISLCVVDELQTCDPCLQLSRNAVFEKMYQSADCFDEVISIHINSFNIYEQHKDPTNFYFFIQQNS